MLTGHYRESLDCYVGWKCWAECLPKLFSGVRLRFRAAGRRWLKATGPACFRRKSELPSSLSLPGGAGSYPVFPVFCGGPAVLGATHAFQSFWRCWELPSLSNLLQNRCIPFRILFKQ